MVGDIHAAEDLNARNQRPMGTERYGHHILQGAVYPVAYSDPVFLRLNMNIGGARLHRLFHYHAESLNQRGISDSTNGQLFVGCFKGNRDARNLLLNFAVGFVVEVDGVPDILGTGGYGLNPHAAVGGKSLQGEDVGRVDHGHFQRAISNSERYGVVPPGHHLRNQLQRLRLRSLPEQLAVVSGLDQLIAASGRLIPRPGFRNLFLTRFEDPYPLMLGKLPGLKADSRRYHDDLAVHFGIVGLGIEQGHLLQAHLLVGPEKIYAQNMSNLTGVGISNDVKGVFHSGFPFDLVILLHHITPIGQRLDQLVLGLEPDRLTGFRHLRRLGSQQFLGQVAINDLYALLARQLLGLLTQCRGSNQNSIDDAAIVSSVGKVEDSLHFCFLVTAGGNADSHGIAGKTIVYASQHIEDMGNARLPDNLSSFAYLISPGLQVFTDAALQIGTGFCLLYHGGDS